MDPELLTCDDLVFDNEFAKELLDTFPWLKDKCIIPLGTTGYFDIHIFKCDDRILAYDTEKDQMVYLGKDHKEANEALRDFKNVKKVSCETGEITEKYAWKWNLNM